MQTEPFFITLSRADGTSLSVKGRSLIACVASDDENRLTAIIGCPTMGDVAQLMQELLNAFGPEQTCLAMSLALISRRIREEE